MSRGSRLTNAKSELENKDVILVTYITHPNCLPSASMCRVCDAALLAAKRNRDRRGWTKKPTERVQGVSGWRNYWMLEFTVDFGSFAEKFYLTKGGTLMSADSGIYKPVNLVNYSETEHDRICTALGRIQLDIRTPIRSSW